MEDYFHMSLDRDLMAWRGRNEVDLFRCMEDEGIRDNDQVVLEKRK